VVATEEADLRPDTLEAPPPDLTAEEAADVAARLFGLSGRVSPLDSERDQNFRIDAAGESFVLKISNPAEDTATIAMQVEAILHVAAVDPGLPVPRVLRTREDEPFAPLERNGKTHVVHALTFLEGEELLPGDLDAETLHDFGAVVARMGRALRGFFHPAAAHDLLWDVKHAARLRPLVAHLESPGQAALVARVLDGFEERALPRFPHLRAQVVHGDLTLTNVLFDGERRPSAVIDFGDLTHTPLVCDLAVALAAVLRGGEDTFDTAEAVLRGYGSVIPLEDGEAAVLADSIAARQAAAVVISAWRVGRFPENAKYITALDAGSWAVLELFDSLGAGEVAHRLRRAAAPALSLHPPLVPKRSGPPTEELLERRRRLFGSAHLPLSYDRPMHMVGGDGVWMVDADGRRYLDAYNNVPVVGHSHPRVVEAIARQARLLNTNTRYLHESALELAQRLTATMPKGLDTCMFVNSGSEANDLAWQLATQVSGGSGGIVSAWAYHGVTAAIAALSPSEWPAGGQRSHVETVPAPDGYRGAHRRDEPGWVERYAVSVGEAAAALADRGHRLAAMLLDSAWTSDGIFTEAPGYLSEAVHRVHEAGGLFVADEVQAGFGRFGSQFWSFQAGGVTPDFVTLGKPMGNGHPVAAVITRAEIADEYARQREPIFSTFGGNPVACAAGLAVLDVLDEERLVERAAQVGEHLRAGLDELARRHPVVGDVRGTGLLLGVELVDEPGRREPSPLRAQAVMNGMRERGVLIGTAGRDGNVLKIRPPLAFDRAHADLLLETLDRVLAEADRV
jgi:4-aminobutyrate aminotransferase-like enzyme/Ser/Thr protein kinase RdoA (MazF antagonist)